VPLLVTRATATNGLCGATVFEDLKLDDDLMCPGDGLVVGADGIKLNLQGHTITGSGIGVGIGLTGRTKVSIFDGTVKNFEAGIRTTDTSDIVIKDSTLIENGDGIDLQSGSRGNVIKANAFRNNRTRGIMLRSGVIDNDIKANTFTGNRVGILLFAGVENTVKGNILSTSTLAGIRINVFASGNLILDNTVIFNPTGIEFLVTPTGSSTGNTLVDNKLVLNACGLKGPTDGNAFRENLFEANGADICS
jgi:parallel beta-helix repeat protein